jgi:hypothetical protein
MSLTPLLKVLHVDKYILDTFRIDVAKLEL